MTLPNRPQDQRNAPLALWRRVRAYIFEVFSICGEPQDLASRGMITLKLYNVCLPWIQAAEALLRRFLLVEAALLTPAPACAKRRSPPVPPPASASSSARKPRDFDPNTPDAWRVSFRLIVAERAARSRDSNKDRLTHASLTRFERRERAPQGFRSAIPLARRLEAVLRAYNNPLPFAQRLAASLGKAQALLVSIGRDVWRKSRDIVGAELYDGVLPALQDAQASLSNTS